MPSFDFVTTLAEKLKQDNIEHIVLAGTKEYPNGDKYLFQEWRFLKTRTSKKHFAQELRKIADKLDGGEKEMALAK